MAGRLVNALGSAAQTAEFFSDAATLRHMLRFEAALAQATAEAGLIPKKHTSTIAKACDPALYDPTSLAAAARRTATVTVPVVKALTAEVAKRDAEAAAYVHWGATSQDVIDTAMVLQLGEALPPLLKQLQGIVEAFAGLAKAARDISLMMQAEVGEASEPSGPGRGGSSTMPHKRNPVGAAVILAAAHRAPMMAAVIVAGLPQEHERALGGWQAEWPALAA